MINLINQFEQLVIGCFLGIYLSISYIYFNNLLTSKFHKLWKNIIEFIFIIVEVFFLIAFLEEYTHGIIGFYSLIAFIICFVSTTLLTRLKTNFNNLNVLIIFRYFTKYLNIILKVLFTSKTATFLSYRFTILCKYFKNSLLRIKE